jgi:hypothetical protein
MVLKKREKISLQKQHCTLSNIVSVREYFALKTLWGVEMKSHINKPNAFRFSARHPVVVYDN